MKTKLPPLTEAELKIMATVWDRGEATVSDVLAAQPQPNPPAYNTVLTQVRLLHEKGLVVREQVGRGHVYRPRVDREQALQRIIKQFADDYFAGSIEALGERAGRPRQSSRQAQDSE